MTVLVNFRSDGSSDLRDSIGTLATLFSSDLLINGSWEEVFTASLF